MKRANHSTKVKAPTFRCIVDGAVSSGSISTETSILPELMTSASSASSRDGRALTAAPTTLLKSRKSNARIDMRAGLSVGTWNVLTLNRTGYVTALVRSLKLSRLSLVGVTEARLVGSGSTRVEGYTVLHSGGVHHVHGVALVISQQLTSCLVRWTPISDRLFLARFTHVHVYLTVIVSYAPTEDSSDEDKGMFYDQLSRTMSQITPQDVRLILGDMNAVTG